MSSRRVLLHSSSVAGPTVTNNNTREAFTLLYYHLLSLVLVQPAVHCLIVGPVCRPICNDDDELDRLLNSVATFEPDLDGGDSSNVNSSLVLLFVTVWPPTDEPRSRRKAHKGSFACDQPFPRKMMLAASIT